MLKHQSAQLHATSKRLFAGQDYLTQVPCNISDEHVSCTAPARRKASLQTPTHAIFFEHATKPTCLPHFWEGAESIAPAMQNDFHILTSKMCFPLQRCALFRHQLPKVIWTRGVLTYYFQMCFAPQRRAPFEHLKFRKWSENGVFLAKWLRPVLRSTTLCTFEHLNFREWCALYVLTSTCASRHSRARFFDTWTSKRAPTMVCF